MGDTQSRRRLVARQRREVVSARICPTAASSATANADPLGATRSASSRARRRRRDAVCVELAGDGRPSGARLPSCDDPLDDVGPKHLRRRLRVPFSSLERLG